MKRAATLFVFIAIFVRSSSADDYPRDPNVDVLHYVFQLTLNDENDIIAGETTIEVRFLAEDSSELTLDLIGKASTDGRTGMEIESVVEDGPPVRFSHVDDRVEIRAAPREDNITTRRFTIRYRGVPADGLIIAKNLHGERTFFGDNFPNRLRHWLPTVDHPYDKATCEFIVTAPDHYQVIASGLLAEETDLPDGLRLTHYRQPVPMSTYLMVIGVARFAVQQLDVWNGVQVQTWVYPQDRDAGFHDFARAPRVIEFFASRVGPYPFGKLANVQSTTRYGGMENSGNIFYGERSITGTRKVEGTMVHEIAHQWFGDSVTTADWNHVWLSEGFATYMRQVFDEFTYGRDRLSEGMSRARRRVLRYHARNPDSRVVDERLPVDKILNANSYQKGAWVLHMLRRLVGDEIFWPGLQTYYAEYRGRNALTEDFQRVMEEASGRELGTFFNQWVYQPGHPVLEVDWTYNAGAEQLNVTLNQTQKSGVVFETSIDLGIEAGGDSEARIETVWMNQRKQNFAISLDEAPTEVVLDPETWLLFEPVTPR